MLDRQCELKMDIGFKLVVKAEIQISKLETIRAKCSPGRTMISATKQAASGVDVQ